MLSDDQEVARAAIHAAMGDGARRLTQSWRSWAQIDALGWAAFAGPHAVCAEA